MFNVLRIKLNNWAMCRCWTKTRRKSIYHTKSLKTNEMGGHPKHLHANTPHISAISRKVLPAVPLVLDILNNKPRYGVSLCFYKLHVERE